MWFERRPRQRVVGSAAVLGALAGLWLAGKCMIWCGWFRPGSTTNADILDYWPGFLTGMLLGSTVAASGARCVWSWLQE